MSHPLKKHVGSWVPGTRSRYQAQLMEDSKGQRWAVLGSYSDHDRVTQLVVMRERDGKLKSHPVHVLGFLVDTKG